MYLVIAGITYLIAFKYGDWKNWRKYEATMFLFSFGNLLYNYVYHDKFLWMFKPDILSSHIIEVIYSVSVYPMTTLLFLTNFPETMGKRIKRIIKYALIYSAVEVVLYLSGLIVYDYGWFLWLSFAWDFVMFTILAIHYKKPVIAYCCCFALFFLMSVVFPFKLD